MNDIFRLIRQLGINSTYRGYRYLYSAILLAMRDEEYLLSITKRMYLDIAHQYETTAGCVERSLRTVISVCWERGNRDFLREITPYPLQTKPTAGEFIDILTAHCKNKSLHV